MTLPAIRTAPASDAERAIAVLVLAFSADAATRWAFPEPSQYLACFPEFVRAFGGRVFDHGTAYCAEDYAGVALWLPPGVQPDQDALGALFQRSVAEQKQGEIFAVLEQM
jgi:hypothetical protein